MYGVMATCVFIIEDDGLFSLIPKTLLIIKHYSTYLMVCWINGRMFRMKIEINVLIFIAGKTLREDEKSTYEFYDHVIKAI